MGESAATVTWSSTKDRISRRRCCGRYRIVHGDIQGIAVLDDGQAAREVSRLELLGLSAPRIVVAPSFFWPQALSQVLRSGRTPSERKYDGGGANA